MYLQMYCCILLPGLQHTAFNMGCEASIDSETSIDEKSVPPGALVTLVEKGFRYLEMEALTKIVSALLNSFYQFR